MNFFSISICNETFSKSRRLIPHPRILLVLVPCLFYGPDFYIFQQTHQGLVMQCDRAEGCLSCDVALNYFCPQPSRGKRGSMPLSCPGILQFTEVILQALHERKTSDISFRQDRCFGNGAMRIGLVLSRNQPFHDLFNRGHSSRKNQGFL